MPISSPIRLDDLRRDPGRVLASTASASLIDLDDGVLCLEFHSKGNTLDGETLAVGEEALRIIPGRYLGLVIGNQGTDFSFGANLRWLLHLLDEIGDDRQAFHDRAKRFQRLTTGMRIAPFPVVAAPFGRTVGGALELSMYCDRVQAHAEVRMRLPEVAVGILPDLGGTSELYARSVEAAGRGNEAAGLRAAFETIVFMRESRDARHARELHFLRDTDRITEELPRLLDDAKASVLELADGYAPPRHRDAIPVLGDRGYAALDGAIGMARAARLASDYDAEIARAIARVMTASPGLARTIPHEEMLDLETRWFETLIFDPRTRARMQHFLDNRTPLRN